MKILNPKTHPNRWLEAILKDLLAQDTPESKAMLMGAIPNLCYWLEPGLIDDLFAEWIDQYMDLVAEQEKNCSNSHQECSTLDQPVGTL